MPPKYFVPWMNENILRTRLNTTVSHAGRIAWCYLTILLIGGASSEVKHCFRWSALLEDWQTPLPKLNFAEELIFLVLVNQSGKGLLGCVFLRAAGIRTQGRTALPMSILPLYRGGSTGHRDTKDILTFSLNFSLVVGREEIALLNRKSQFYSRNGENEHQKVDRKACR